jgi:hypothetical protein
LISNVVIYVIKKLSQSKVKQENSSILWRDRVIALYLDVCFLMYYTKRCVLWNFSQRDCVELQTCFLCILIIIA